MERSRTLTLIVPLITVLVISASLAGLFWQHDGVPFTFTTLRNQTVEIYGQGLYQNDMTLYAVGYRIADAYNLLLGIPFLLISFYAYQRGSLRGGFLMAGALAFMLYQYSSLAIGAAYNNLFVVYILVTIAAFIGLLRFIRSVNEAQLPQQYDEQAPLRGSGIYLLVSGVILFLIWLILSILPALLAGTVPPELGSYHTIITFVVDMAFIAPCLVATGILLLRRSSLGLLLAPIALVFIDALGLGLILMGIGQMLLWLMSIGQFIGFVVSFAILTFFAIGYSITLLRHIGMRVTQTAFA